MTANQTTSFSACPHPHDAPASGSQHGADSRGRGLEVLRRLHDLFQPVRAQRLPRQRQCPSPCGAAAPPDRLLRCPSQNPRSRDPSRRIQPYDQVGRFDQRKGPRDVDPLCHPTVLDREPSRRLGQLLAGHPPATRVEPQTVQRPWPGKLEHVSQPGRERSLPRPSAPHDVDAPYALPLHSTPPARTYARTNAARVRPLIPASHRSSENCTAPILDQHFTHTGPGQTYTGSLTRPDTNSPHTERGRGPRAAFRPRPVPPFTRRPATPGVRRTARLPDPSAGSGRPPRGPALWRSGEALRRDTRPALSSTAC